jgi:predicted small lipoprotein YifL
MYDQMWKASCDNVAQGIIAWQETDNRRGVRFRGLIHAVVFSLVSCGLKGASEKFDETVDEQEESKEKPNTMGYL